MILKAESYYVGVSTFLPLGQLKRRPRYKLNGV